MSRNTRKDYEEAKEQLAQLINNPDLTEDQITRVREMNNYLQSVRNYSAANPRNNATQRDMETEAYKVAARYIQDGTVPVSGAAMGTENIFNGENHREVVGDTGAIFHNYMSLGRGTGTGASNAGYTSTGAASAPAGSNIFYFKWNKGLNSGWGAPGETFNERATSYITQLISNLQDAKTANTNKRTIRNLTAEQIASLDDWINTLTSIKAKLSSDTTEADKKSVMQALSNIVRNFTNDPSSFMEYFGELAPGADRISKNKKKLTDDQYIIRNDDDFTEFLTNLGGGYHVVEKNGKQYLVTSDYSSIVKNTPKTYLNTDWRNPGKEGYGYIIGDDGSFIAGNLSLYYDNSSLNKLYYDQLHAYVDALNNRERAALSPVNFDVKADISDYDIINKNAVALQGKKVADMSRYFDTEVPIIATVQGNNWDAVRSKYGHVKLDDAAITYYWGDGKSGNYKQLVADLGIQPNLQRDQPSRGYNLWRSSLQDLVGIQKPENWDDSLDANHLGNWHNFWSKDKTADISGKGGGMQPWTDVSDIDFDQDVTKNPVGVARYVLLLLVTEDSNLNDYLKRIKNLWWVNHPTDAIYLIYNAMTSDPNIFKGPHESDYWQAWRVALTTNAARIKLNAIPVTTTEIPASKEGGILKAADGTYIDGTGAVRELPESLGESVASAVRLKAAKIATAYNKTAEEALRQGRSIGLLKAIEDNDWSSSDTLRATALATDIVGLIAAIAGAATGGVGSAVAIGSGFLSMALDAIADFTDEKVSTAEAWKNVGVNTGLAIGAAVGAKAPKIVKSALKLVPKAMMAAAAAGTVFDPNVHNTIQRLSEGKSLNTEDWRNIILVLRTATGIASVGATEHGSKKALKQFDKRVAEEIKKSGAAEDLVNIGEGTSKKQISKSAAKEVDNFLNQGKEADAKQAIARELNISEEEAAKYLQTVEGKRKWYKPWEKEASTTKLITDNPDGTYTVPDDIKAEIYSKLRAEAELNYNTARTNHKILAKLDDFTGKVSPIKALNYALNALYARTAMGPLALDKFINENQSVIEAFTPEKFNALAVRGMTLSERSHRHSHTDAIAEVKEAGLVYDEKKGKWVVPEEIGKALSEAKDKGKHAGEAYQSELSKEQTAMDSANNQINKFESGLSQKELAKFRKLQNARNQAALLVDLALVAELLYLDAHPNLRAPIKQNGLWQPLPYATRDKGYKAVSQALKTAQLLLDTARKNLYSLSTTKTGKLRNGYISPKDYLELKKTAQKAAKNIQQILNDIKKAKADADNEFNRAKSKYEKIRAEGLAKLLDARLKGIDIDKNPNLVNKPLQEATLKAVLAQSLDIGKIRKPVTLENGVTIPKDAKVKSYSHIRGDIAGAYEKQHPKAVKLSKEEVKKLVHFSNREKIRGGFYDATSKELIIYKQGGKYSHLRK